MWIAGDAYGDRDYSAISVPALLPPLFLLYALRARFEPLRQTIAAFVAEHHVERVFKKRTRERADPEALARRGPRRRSDHER